MIAPSIPVRTSFRTGVLTRSKESALSILAFVGLGIVAVTSVVLWLFGSRFTKGYIAKYGQMPRLTWMFRRSPDPELEVHRRQALITLPFYLVGVILYFASGPPA
jgi:hypothetical protein